MAEVTVASNTIKPSNRPGPEGLAALTPIQAGLLYGGVTSSILGPAGILVGLGAGILSKKLRKNFADRETAIIENSRIEHNGIQNEIDAEMRIADPDEKRLLTQAQRLANEGWNRLMSGDPTGREMFQQANEMARGIMTADRDQRKQEQTAQASMLRNLVSTSATGYRDEYQKGLASFEEVNSLSDRVLKLVSQPGFDPNKPFNKAVLTDLLTVGVGGLYRDNEGVLGTIPLVGQFLEKGADTLSGKFDVTAEDFNRVAMSMKQANENSTQRLIQRLGQQSQQLDQYAKQQGILPQDYSLADYITGGVRELQLTPVQSMPQVKQVTDDLKRLRKLPPSEKYMGPANQALRGLEQWMNSRKKQKRPTN